MCFICTNMYIFQCIYILNTEFMARGYNRKEKKWIKGLQDSFLGQPLSPSQTLGDLWLKYFTVEVTVIIE